MFLTLVVGLTPRRWRRSGPPRRANCARVFEVELLRAPAVVADCLMLFRRSSSRSARGVSQIFDSLSQNVGGKFGAILTTAVDLTLLAGGLSCVRSCVFRLLRCRVDKDCRGELGGDRGIWRSSVDMKSEGRSRGDRRVEVRIDRMRGTQSCVVRVGDEALLTANH